MDEQKIKEIMGAGEKISNDWYVVPTMELNIDCPHCDASVEISKQGLTLQESMEWYFVKDMVYNCPYCGKLIRLGTMQPDP